MSSYLKPFKYYLESNKVKKKAKNPVEGKALLEKARSRLRYVKSQDIDEQNSEFILEDAYETIREAAQSLMALKGYKPYSHEATISFVREFFDVFNEGELSDFDYFRKARNLAIYAGKNIPMDETKEIIEFSEMFLGKVEKIWTRIKTDS